MQDSILEKFKKLIYPLVIEPDRVINGDVRLTLRKNLGELPTGLTINGNLHLTDSDIGELPKYLAVNGYVNISGTKISTLPDSLMVDDRIYFGTIFLNSNKRYILSDRIGTRLGQTMYDTQNDMITCGCFYGTLDEFITQVNHTHNNPKNLKYYLEYVKFINSISHIN